MDQSLRTVATQLLNATAKREDLVRIPDEKIVTIETPMQVVHVSTRAEDSTNDISNDKQDDSTKMKFGIPINSKFGHFEISNPGHAMAMTDEEIEREMELATTTSPKYRPTTASMLSTWIQLYPPSTTSERNNISEIKTESLNNQIYSLPNTKLSSTVFKLSTAHTKPNQKTETKSTTISSTEASLSTTKILKTISTTDASNYVQLSTTLPATLIENKTTEVDLTDKKSQNYRTSPSIQTTMKSITSTKKNLQKGNSTTLKPKITTPKNSSLKLVKVNSTINRFKPVSTRRPIKNDTVTSTSKIEKVTLKPTTNISHNHTYSTEKPLFITKIKATVLTNAQKTTTTVPMLKPSHSILSKSNFSNTEFTSTKIPRPTQVNNILKVSLKKPVDDSTKIEIQPIRVNPPILTIEKIDDSNSSKKNDDQDILENSKIDVKFDFSPAYTNVKLQTASVDDSLTDVPSTTTKRSRLSNKRKKNKNRRRKPSTTITSTLTTPSSAPLDNQNVLPLDTHNNVKNENYDKVQLISIQESKIEPESKAPPKKKKPSQTQVQKPIGTQIYNFLSREVMPSVGVMSLVGLGLGLASYFLYPFGGVMARRNYEVDPNYKYNFDEYGGNYGLSEEEVLSKVYSGMTSNQYHEPKYNSIATSEKNPTFYRYTGSDQTQQQSSRYSVLPFQTSGNRVIYRPVETTAYDVNYRNTEFKYPDVPTTPNYYERQRQQLSTDFASNVKTGIVKNRQFVVGNIPKEYSNRDIDKQLEVAKVLDKTEETLSYKTNIENNSSASPLTASNFKSVDNISALALNNDKSNTAEIYEELEITPTAVAVEHGPRFLKSFNGVLNYRSGDSKLIRKKRSFFSDISKKQIPFVASNVNYSRIKRSSVIQVIPSKSEIEKENKIQEQEDLSNEILNIIDDVLPEKMEQQKKKYNEKNESVKNKASKKQDTKASNNVLNDTNKVSSKSIITTEAISSNKYSTITDHMLPSITEKEGQHISSATLISEGLVTTSTTQPDELTESDLVDQTEATSNSYGNNHVVTPTLPQTNSINIIGIAKKVAEIKVRLGLTILKHASEGFARYIGHIQKRFNGEE